MLTISNAISKNGKEFITRQRLHITPQQRRLEARTGCGKEV